MDIVKDITYCNNVLCTRSCERNIKNHDFTGQVFSIANFHEVKNFEESKCEYFYPTDETRNYTEIWNGFQIRPPVFLDGHFESDYYDVVKWVDHEPYEVTDFKTGKKKMSTRSCYTIATLKWDKKESSFQFESCGLRYLEDRIAGLEDWILNFCKKIEREKELEEGW